jgi:hypothetical protein
MINEKLNYITITINKISNCNEDKTHSNNYFNLFNNFDKKTINLIDKEAKKYISNPKNKMDLRLKKLRISQAYFNIVLFTIALKYADILYRVKLGGIIYFTSLSCCCYFLNKFFRQFKCGYLIEQMSTLNNISSECYLKELKIKENKLSKEENLTTLNLNKYWKEPMSWH